MTLESIYDGVDVEEVRRRWESIYLDPKIPPEKKAMIRVLTTMFTLAWDSYVREESGWYTDQDLVQMVGVNSERYMAGWDYVMKCLRKASEKETLDKVDEISAWLGQKGWLTLPVYESRSGEKVTVTANGMHSDMVRRHEAVVGYRAEIKRQRQQAKR